MTGYQILWLALMSSLVWVVSYSFFKSLLMLRIEALPAPSCHETGWSAKMIDGRWRVGMTGNLDSIHDAIITVNSHTSDGEEAREIAEWIAKTYNGQLDK